MTKFQPPDDHVHFASSPCGMCHVTSRLDAHPVGLKWFVWIYDYMIPTPFRDEVQAVIYLQRLTRK